MTTARKVTWSRSAPGTACKTSPDHPAGAKLQLIDDLADAGHTVIEAGSFVNPKWVPQMADSDEVFAGISARPAYAIPPHAQPAGF